jgi:hypothetical protein
LPAAGVNLTLSHVEGGQNFFLPREFPLLIPDEGIADPAIGIDQEHRRAGDVPGVEADAVPDAEGPQCVARLVDQDVEGQPCFLDVGPDRTRVLRDDARDLDPPCGVCSDVVGKLTEPAAAVRSPGAAMKRQQQPPAREIVGERVHAPFLVRQCEIRRLREV